MSISKSMEYGTEKFHFDVPAGFRAMYPVGCGYLLQEAVHVPCSAPQGLLTYILSGSGELSLAGEALPYQGHTAVFAQRGGDLLLRPGEPTEYLYLLIENALPLPAPLTQPICQLKQDNLVRRMLERIFRTGRNGNIYDAACETFRLMVKLSELYTQASAAYSPLVQGAIDCIRDEYAFLTGMEDVAERVGVTKSHLIRVFSAAVGQSPGKFLQATRIENAMLLLQGSEYTVDMVAGLCGFSGANYFCKVFRRATGESPGVYRGRVSVSQDQETHKKLQKLEQHLL